MIAAYRLLRNFCISYNLVYLTKKEDDRQEVPPKYAAEVEKIMGSKATFEMFQKALKSNTVDESISVLPDKLEKAVVDGLIDFLNKNDDEEVVKYLN